MLWDVLAKKEIASIALPGKAFSLDVHKNRIVVATSNRRLAFIDYSPDTAKLEIVLERESSLKYQSRCVSFLQGGIGVALGSIEGRVAIEFLPELGISSDNKKKYAFKCHRVHDTVYPVNCLALHPVHGTFATGGCDGTVVTWDGLHKKKLATLPSFSTSIAALTFSPGDGSHLAIAASYTFEEGERDHPKDEMFVRRMLDSEVLPKTK
jgi:cell cycle arrest protein BUB3